MYCDLSKVEEWGWRPFVELAGRGVTRGVVHEDEGMRVALDTNCLLDAADQTASGYEALWTVMAAATSGRVQLFVSRHSLSELTKPGPVTEQAKLIASIATILPHYPIGAWSDQIVSWDQVSGTWEDARRNHEIQLELASLAKAGNDIRDRGAYIDAVMGRIDVFVTSDRQFAGSGPAKRIEARFGLRVAMPRALAAQLAE